MFDISLAEWSLHREIYGERMTNMDFPRVAKETCGISAIEFVNGFFKDKAHDRAYLDDLIAQCVEHEVTPLLIMIDGEGWLGDEDDDKRTLAVENHFRWVTAAWYMGCHSIRVNAGSSGSRERQRDLVVDGLTRLATFADPYGIDVIVENHGGLSSDGAWLAEVMATCDHPRIGTLPDFGNFNIGDGRTYDRYQGVTELMPYAKAVSAKSHDFDADGNERHTDYPRMLNIVKDAGYRGYVGVEYEGNEIGELEGIRLTKELLERCFAAMPEDADEAGDASDTTE